MIVEEIEVGMLIEIMDHVVPALIGAKGYVASKSSCQCEGCQEGWIITLTQPITGYTGTGVWVKSSYFKLQGSPNPSDLEIVLE